MCAASGKPIDMAISEIVIDVSMSMAEISWMRHCLTCAFTDLDSEARKRFSSTRRERPAALAMSFTYNSRSGREQLYLRKICDLLVCLRQKILPEESVEV